MISLFLPIPASLACRVFDRLRSYQTSVQVVRICVTETLEFVKCLRLASLRPAYPIFSLSKIWSQISSGMLTCFRSHRTARISMAVTFRFSSKYSCASAPVTCLYEAAVVEQLPRGQAFSPLPPNTHAGYAPPLWSPCDPWPSSEHEVEKPSVDVFLCGLQTTSPQVCRCMSSGARPQKRAAWK